MPEADLVPIHFPPELPITARVRDIAAAIDAHPVVIVAGATGSGKTTQLPKIALAMGRGVEKLIGVTQPRRIAATSVAARVASEIGVPLGEDVGYQIRFEDRTSPRTYVKFMTDGILLAEIQGDRLLRKYDTLILDEAHERTLTIDFLLGWVRRILPERPDLKVLVSSATLETERFAAFFGGAPVIAVEGRTHPVDVLYEPPADDADLPRAVADAVANVTSLDPQGDVLVFLPGEREIRDVENELAARALRHTQVLPLYARLPAKDQARIFASVPQRRVILATNVAETSVTIPGIVYVIDTGVARLSRYDPRSGTTRLQIEGISKASAEQRKGRSGRVRPGICVRLYDEASFAARPDYTDPEIKRTGLAGVILRMKSYGLGDPESLPLLDPPASKAITEGYRVLDELGALGPDKELTPIGVRLARFPVDPRIGRMILAGAEHGCLADVLVVAAALTLQDPRERPRDAQQRADDAHRPFRDERSDFVGLLRLWELVREADRRGTSALRRTCKETFLSFLRVREWMEIHRQLSDVARELGLARADGPGRGDVHVALLTGLLSRIGQWNPEARVYVGARQTRFALHPSSALAKKPPAWIMAFELVETSQLFARMAAKIEPEWLLTAAPHLLKKSYSEPHWSEKSARAFIKEQATLFGLPVLKDRNVDYASVAPAPARRMFLEHALVRGELRTRGAFQEKNRARLAEVARLRDKARRSEMLADDEALIAFFDRRVPEDVADGKSFEVWRAKAEAADPELLVFSLEDVLAGDPGLSPADYPDAITVHGVPLPVTYRFDPSADDDGITITVPLALLPQLDPRELDWTIPGWHRAKIAAILHELPRAARRDLGSIGELAEAVAAEVTPFRGPMVPALVRAIADLTGASVPEDALRPEAAPTYLRATYRIVDASGKALDQGRDVEALFREHGALARAAWKSTAAPPRFERAGLTRWDFGDLPEHVTRKVGPTELRSYPAIVDRGKAVDLTLLETAAAADAASRAGVRRLVVLTARGAVSAVEARVPAPFPRLDGGFTPRADQDAFRAQVLARIVDDAYGLAGPGPRTARAFTALVEAGNARVDAAFQKWRGAVTAASTELETTLRAVRSAAKQPSGQRAAADVQAQLARMFPGDLVATVPLEVLQHFPRYLRAAQLRVQRALADPRKDADKLAPFTPVWTAFLGRASTARERDAADELRWRFEELRVAIFAPELKTAMPVSLPRMAEAVAALR